MTAHDDDAANSEPALAFPTPHRSPDPHAEYHRQATAHFRSVQPAAPQPAATTGPVTGQSIYDFAPWHGAAAITALSLLIALVAAQSFSWMVLALLSATAGWYLKTRNVAWPPTVREALVRRRLATPAPPTGASSSASLPPPQPVHRPTPDINPAGESVPQWFSSNAEATPGAAMIAALFAVTLGIYWLFQTYDLWHIVSGFSGRNMAGAGTLRATFIVEALVCTATTIALVAGGVQLLNRNLRGRGWIVFGCLIVLADAIVTWANIEGEFNFRLSAVPSVVVLRVFSAMVHSQDDLKVWVLIGTIVPLLTLILASSRATYRWCGGAAATSGRQGLVAASAAAAGLVLVVAVLSGQREHTVVSTPTPTTTTPASGAVADPSALAIKNASVGDCINRTEGSLLNDGTHSATVTSVSCASSSATDVVTAITDHTGACGTEWVQSRAFIRPIVLCLRKM
jgi:hypothetical protein